MTKTPQQLRALLELNGIATNLTDTYATLRWKAINSGLLDETTGAVDTTGATGGATGAKGDRGAQGDKGADGATGAAGTNGSNGSNGTAATIAVGTVATGAAGSSTTVANSGTTSAATFDFSIPKGDAGNNGSNGTDGTDGTNGTNGSNGAAATINVGTTTTGAAGSAATVANSGSPTAATFDFAIPQGTAGTNGSNGSNGSNGTDGAVGAPAGCDAKAAYGANTDVDGSVTYNAAENAMRMQSNTDTAIGMAYPAFNVEHGNEINIAFTFKSDVVNANGVYCRVYEYDSDLPAGKTVISANASAGPSYVQEQTRGGSLSTTISNTGVTTDYQTIHTTYTPTSTAKWASVVILKWSGMPIASPLFVRPLIPSVAFSAGSNNQVMFNDNGTTSGDSGLLFDKTTNDLIVAGTIKNQGSELKIAKVYAYNFPVGWYSVALVQGSAGGSGAGTGSGDQRATAQFYFRDTMSGLHQTVIGIVSHHFGTDDSNNIQILNTSNYNSGGPSPIQSIRIKELSTYDGGVLQIYLTSATNRVACYLTDNNQTAGWKMLDAPVPDATDPSNALYGVGYNNNYSQFTVAETVDLTGIHQGGFRVGGNARFDGGVRQSASTNAVLVSNGNGDIVSASNVTDVPYVPAGGAGNDPFNFVNPALWQGAPPNTIDAAIERIAAQLNVLGGPIP